MFWHQDVSGLFWWAGHYLGWVSHFCVLQFWNSCKAGWGPERRQFIVLSSTKKALCYYQAPTQQQRLDRVFYPALNHNTLFPSLLDSNLSLILRYICVWTACNISSHWIIQFRWLIQYLPLYLICFFSLFIKIYIHLSKTGSITSSLRVRLLCMLACHPKVVFCWHRAIVNVNYDECNRPARSNV